MVPLSILIGCLLPFSIPIGQLVPVFLMIGRLFLFGKLDWPVVLALLLVLIKQILHLYVKLIK